MLGVVFVPNADGPQDIQNKIITDHITTKGITFKEHTPHSDEAEILREQIFTLSGRKPTRDEMFLAAVWPSGKLYHALVNPNRERIDEFCACLRGPHVTLLYYST